MGQCDSHTSSWGIGSNWLNEIVETPGFFSDRPCMRHSLDRGTHCYETWNGDSELGISSLPMNIFTFRRNVFDCEKGIWAYKCAKIRNWILKITLLCWRLLGLWRKEVRQCLIVTKVDLELCVWFESMAILLLQLPKFCSCRHKLSCIERLNSYYFPYYTRQESFFYPAFSLSSHLSVPLWDTMCWRNASLA